MKNYTSKFPLPTGNTWARLPERVMALESTKKISGAISQSSTNAPVFTSLTNPTGATITFGYTSTGTFTITSNLPIFTSGKTFLKISIGANKFFATFVVNSTTQITFTTSDSTGTLANSLLSGNMITIEIFN